LPIQRNLQLGFNYNLSITSHKKI